MSFVLNAGAELVPSDQTGTIRMLPLWGVVLVRADEALTGPRGRRPGAVDHRWSSGVVFSQNIPCGSTLEGGGKEKYQKCCG